MPLDDDERYLRDQGWSWYLDALLFHRDSLTKDEERDPAREGIERAKVDYYRVAISDLAEMERRRKAH